MDEKQLTNEDIQEVIAEYKHIYPIVADVCYELLDLRKANELVSVEDELPTHGQPVIAHYNNSHGKSRRVMAEYLVKFTEEWDGEDDDKCLEYDESVDIYYYEAGWYECIDNWGDFTSIKITEGIVDSWQLRPKPPEQDK